ncbi:enoyl-CoA hydratase [Frigidibacter albus]|uniref:Enoyl-CoA hydratase n=1 Tax=Frigidibacter albus TaxID=1465486 RepID=A0A6L8VNN8_9RHOB|nr:enoyl-CoA hydratase-related protein [Frigidibacter albus]MZQ91092.1 enoyl-CoA hydratase [Frigidibacter albus]NBE32977.1 enoyl-CoA hydratase [Frigidibacter albus]GGH62748.1 2-(1,2-epoxy-1,2-dihydrophenyl)acetyl-CoA isomerase [Frigidibacter albus]
MSDPILLDIAGGIARLRFNRPDRLNAINVPLSEGFAAAVERVLADPTVRVVLLTGEGRAFMAGGDLAGFSTSDDKGDAARAVINPMHAGLKGLEAGAPLVIAAAQGAVAGAGMSVFAGADIGLAASDATFNMAYSRVGVVPDCGGSWALPRLVGLRRALALALTAQTIDAEEAQRIGLASRVVPAADLEAEAVALARKLADGPPQALSATKRLIRGAFAADYAAQLDAEAAGFLACAETTDFTEALSAFFEKRRPNFTGR